MNVPPPPRNEGKGAPFEPGGSWSREGTTGAVPPGAGPPPGTHEPHGPAPGAGAPMAAAGGSPTADARYPLAGWGQRVVARLIDWIVVGIPSAIAGMLVGFLWIGAQTMIAGYGDSAISRNFWLIFAVCCFVVATAYDTVCVKRWRRTIGKRAMGLEVAPLSTGGRQGPIPVASMVARAALLSVMFLVAWNEALQAVAFLFVLVFIALWPLWDGPNRQGMHDKLAGTVVVRTG